MRVPSEHWQGWFWPLSTDEDLYFGGQRERCSVNSHHGYGTDKGKRMKRIVPLKLRCHLLSEDKATDAEYYRNSCK